VIRSMVFGIAVVLASAMAAEAQQGFTFANEPIPPGTQLGTYGPGRVAIDTNPSAVYVQPGTGGPTVLGAAPLQAAQAGKFMNGAVPAGNGQDTSSSGDGGTMARGVAETLYGGFGPTYPSSFNLTGPSRSGQQFGPSRAPWTGPTGGGSYGQSSWGGQFSARPAQQGPTWQASPGGGHFTQGAQFGAQSGWGRPNLSGGPAYAPSLLSSHRR
jgi:hypothetical protein